MQNKLVEKDKEILKINDKNAADISRLQEEIEQKDRELLNIEDRLEVQVSEFNKVIKEKEGELNNLNFGKAQAGLQNSILKKQLEIIAKYAEDILVEGREITARNYRNKRYFLIVKRLAGLVVHPKASLRFWADKKELLQSGLYDENYYLKNNRDLCLTTANLLRHFLIIGYREGRKAHPLIDIQYYYRCYPDVKITDSNPILHFIRFGCEQGYNPHPLFDTSYYCQHYGSEVRGYNPLVYFLKEGGGRGHNPSPVFNTNFYLDTYPDVKKSGVNPLVHFVEHGWKEGRCIHPEIDTVEFFKSVFLGERNSSSAIEIYSNLKEFYKTKISELPTALCEANFDYHKDIFSNKHKLLTGAQPGIYSDYKLPQAKYRYCIDRAENYFISGWIFKKDSPDSSIILFLLIDGVLVGKFENKQKRKDVACKYDCGEKAGFKVRIPVHYLDNKTHFVSILVKDENKYILSYQINDKSLWYVEKKNPLQKRILFCSHNLRSQGAQNSLYELVSGLKSKYNIEPIVYSPQSGPLADKYKEKKIQVIVDETFNLNIDSLEGWHEQVLHWSNKLKGLNVDGVVCNTLRTFYMVHVAKVLNLKTLFIPRESEPPETYFDYLPVNIRKLATKTVEVSDQVIFVADSTKMLWQGQFPEKKFNVIHNSLNISSLGQRDSSGNSELRASFGLGERDMVLLSLGTVSWRKGQIDFVKALPGIMAERPDVKAIIVGMVSHQGSEIGEYNQVIYEKIDAFPEAIKERIILIPETDTISFSSPCDFYTVADLLAFTSIVESFPRVVLEAMYYSLPIVTTPCFGVVEQCVEGGNADFYESGDVESLAQKIGDLIDDKGRLKQYAEMSKALFQEMQTYTKMLERYHSIIDRM